MKALPGTEKSAEELWLYLYEQSVLVLYRSKMLTRKSGCFVLRDGSAVVSRRSDVWQV